MTKSKQASALLQFIGCATLICGGFAIAIKNTPVSKFVNNITDYNEAFSKAAKEQPNNSTVIAMGSCGL